jgi:hypothetical protein
LPGGVTQWSTTTGIGDPDVCWTYSVSAVDALDREMAGSNRLGERDFKTQAAD